MGGRSAGAGCPVWHPAEPIGVETIIAQATICSAVFLVIPSVGFRRRQRRTGPLIWSLWLRKITEMLRLLAGYDPTIGTMHEGSHGSSKFIFSI